jgi:hypothetical protein
VLLDRLPIDVGAVGAVHVLEEGIVQDRDDRRMVTADRQIVDLDIVVRLAPDGRALFFENHLLKHQTIHAQNQPGHHNSYLKPALTKLGAKPPRGAGRHDDNRDIIHAAPIIGQINQMFGRQPGLAPSAPSTSAISASGSISVSPSEHSR